MCQIKKYGLKEPEFINLDGDVRVNLFRKTIQTVHEKSNSNAFDETIQTKSKTDQTSKKHNDNKDFVKTNQINEETKIMKQKSVQTLSQNFDSNNNSKTIQTKNKTDQIINNSFVNEVISDKSRSLLEIIFQNNSITIEEIAEKLSWTVSNVKYHINKLKKLGLIKRVGTIHNGHWQIKLFYK